MRNSRPGLARRLFAALMAFLLISQSAFANLTTCSGTCSTCPCKGSVPGSGPNGGPGAGNGNGLPATAIGAGAPGGTPSPYGSPDVTPFRPFGGFASPDVMFGGFIFGNPWTPRILSGPYPATGSAHVSSLSLTVNFGRAAGEDVDLVSQFSVYAQTPSPLLPTRQYLQYRNWLLDRILQTEVATANAPTILGDDWEDKLDTFSVYGRVTTDDTLGEGITHQVRILQERREAVVFRFTPGSAVGVPTGDHSALDQVLAMLDSTGAETTSLPA
ncbi:MAG: hypothetical protein IJS15_07205 [Victivallales bacterium]|nr:hypothetical protein [Victivallales bacterium]